MPRKKPPKPITYERFNELILEKLYKDAVANKQMLWPDDAIRKIFSPSKKANEHKAKEEKDRSEEQLTPDRVNPIALMRKAHLYAVELFYKYYSPIPRGAPRLSDAYLDYILKLHEQKMSYREIAEKVGLPTDTIEDAEHSKDIIRKQITTAKKRRAKQST